MESTTKQETMEEFACKTAAAIGATAGYIKSHDFQKMLGDVEDAARQNPMPALIGAAAVGVLLGAFLRRG